MWTFFSNFFPWLYLWIYGIIEEQLRAHARSSCLLLNSGCPPIICTIWGWLTFQTFIVHSFWSLFWICCNITSLLCFVFFSHEACRIQRNDTPLLFFLAMRHVGSREMAPHSGILAWKIPWMEDPGRLQSMGSLRVGHTLSIFTLMHWRRKWQPTPVFLPAESQGWGRLVGCHLCGRTELDTTKAT